MGQELSKKFHSIEQTELQNQLLLSLERPPILPLPITQGFEGRYRHPSQQSPSHH